MSLNTSKTNFHTTVIFPLTQRFQISQNTNKKIKSYRPVIIVVLVVESEAQRAILEICHLYDRVFPGRNDSQRKTVRIKMGELFQRLLVQKAS